MTKFDGFDFYYDYYSDNSESNICCPSGHHSDQEYLCYPDNPELYGESLNLELIKQVYSPFQNKMIFFNMKERKCVSGKT